MAKSFQDRIRDLQDYRPDIMYKDGAFILKIRFNKNWQIIQPKDESVAYSKDENIQDLHWYVSTIEDSDNVFDLIEETITVNKEFEKKATLYKEKVKELQDLFLSDTPYEKLKNVKFVIENKETKSKGKKTPKTKTSTTETVAKPDNIVEPQENDNENQGDGEVSGDEQYTGDIDAIIEQAIGK